MYGDLIQLAKSGEFNAIAHGCNCFCTMGGGIALQIKKNFPKAYRADLKTEKGDLSKLGTFTSAYVEKYDLDVINLYTQYRYGGKGTYVNYYAVEDCMRNINARYKGCKIGFPKIGCGLAGGDWKIIRKIMVRELTDIKPVMVIYENGGE